MERWFRPNCQFSSFAMRLGQKHKCHQKHADPVPMLEGERGWLVGRALGRGERNCRRQGGGNRGTPRPHLPSRVSRYPSKPWTSLLTYPRHLIPCWSYSAKENTQSVTHHNKEFPFLFELSPLSIVSDTN